MFQIFKHASRIPHKNWSSFMSLRSVSDISVGENFVPWPSTFVCVKQYSVVCFKLLIQNLFCPVFQLNNWIFFCLICSSSVFCFQWTIYDVLESEKFSMVKIFGFLIFQTNIELNLLLSPWYNKVCSCFSGSWKYKHNPSSASLVSMIKVPMKTLAFLVKWPICVWPFGRGRHNSLLSHLRFW